MQQDHVGLVVKEVTNLHVVINVVSIRPTSTNVKGVIDVIQTNNHLKSIFENYVLACYIILCLSHIITSIFV